MELKDFLLWIISGGGGGIIAYALMEEIVWLASLPPKNKRRVAFLLSAALGMASYYLGIVMGYSPAPVTPNEWVENLWLAGMTAAGLAQIIHGEKKLH